MSVKLPKPGSNGNSDSDNDDVLFGDNNDQGNDQGQGFLHKFQTVLGNLNANATDGNGHVLQGTGNPSTNWEIQTNGNFQLGTSVHYRFGDQVMPVGSDDGTLIYNVPAGPQVVDPTHHVPTAAANRNTVNWDYSFSTSNGTNGESLQGFLTHGQMLIQIDTDPGKGTNFLTLHAVYDPALNSASTRSSGIVWEDNAGHVIIGDDQGNANVTQNSQNPAFYASLIDTNPTQPGIQPPSNGIAPPGQYDLVFEMIDHKGNASAQGLASSDDHGNGHIVALQHTQLNLTAPT
jgi:hypothetical protein